MRNLVAAILFSGLCACAGTVQYSATADVETPDLVEVSPGVQVVADYDEPIFYSGGSYWREDGGTWYRSNNYSTGWIYAEPPSAVISIGDTHRYAHYRPNGYVQRHRPTHRVEPVRQENRHAPVHRVEPAHAEHHEEHHEEHHDDHKDGPVVRDHRN